MYGKKEEEVNDEGTEKKNIKQKRECEIMIFSSVLFSFFFYNNF